MLKVAEKINSNRPIPVTISAIKSSDIYYESVRDLSECINWENLEVYYDTRAPFVRHIHIRIENVINYMYVDILPSTTLVFYR